MTTTKGRTVGTNKLDAASLRTLRERLRTDTGPVNLTAVAKEVCISRTTLLKYIKDEPGLQEALDKRRQEAGRGYVLMKRTPKPAPKPNAAAPVPAASRTRDPLPTGSKAAMWASLYHWEASHLRGSLRGQSMDPDMSPDAPMQSHLSHVLDKAEVYRGLADGSITPDVARRMLDELPQPEPLYTPTPASIAAIAKRKAKREAVAQEFKAVEGYLPSSRKLDRLTGVPPARLFDPEAFAQLEQQRKMDRDLAKAAGQQPGSSPRRKSYPNRPRDAQGRPVVPRGRMAELQREQEARGLTGQAAKDAAVKAALAEAKAKSRT